MKSKNALLKRVCIAGGAVLIVLGSLAIRPVPIVSEAECLEVTGVVDRIFEGGPFDVTFKLQGIDRHFYINRGMERGLDLQDLQVMLVGQTVTLKYPEYWTPLDPTGSTRHVSKLEFGDEVFFDETL